MKQLSKPLGFIFALLALMGTFIQILFTVAFLNEGVFFTTVIGTLLIFSLVTDSLFILTLIDIDHILKTEKKQ